ncbi:hypothetical protein FACS189426_06160 [Bacteroidia bacterium]|nr:hypothetical protein FACS189426_06160 [Bacteroidia bacterium]GHV71242.1 hypothetical protein FACS189420_5620 [Bacteroidia bacterium]
MTDELYKYPFCTIEGKSFINPKGIIQLSLSRLRDSKFSDAEIADYISNFLFIIMNKNKFDITTSNLKNGMYIEFINRNKAD